MLGGALWRHGRRVAVCLPALVAVAVAAGLAVAVASTTRHEIVRRYEEAAVRSLRAGERERGRVCVERLLLVPDLDDAARFRLAQMVDALGEHDRATALVDELAPLDRPGHGPAQLATALTLLRRGRLSPRECRDAEDHLRRVLETQPDSVEAHAVLGQLYAQTGRAHEARPHLTRIVQERPELLLMLARVCALDGSAASGLVYAEESLRLFGARSADRPADREARLRWADAALFLKDFPRAEAILKDGLARGDSRDFHKALGGVYAGWAQSLADGSKSDAGACLEVVERGLRHDPANPQLVQLVGQLMVREGPEAGRARAILKDFLVDGRATATVHFLLGLDAWQGDRRDEARLHWERAHAMAPELVEVSNNLAWALSTGPAADLPRALQLIELALDGAPDRPTFRGTRGHVLVAMGRWKEALADLEAALPSDRSNPDLHGDLARTYEALGRPDLAAEHARRARSRATDPPPAGKR